jgi:xanthine dehydrogenase accessory factor
LDVAFVRAGFNVREGTEPVAGSQILPMLDLYPAIVDLLARGGRGALVTIVRASGSTPQRVGAKMLVLEDGATIGTIGGGCYENDAVLKARHAMSEGRAELVRYDLNDDFAEESGLICGGQMDVFIEPVAAAPELFVFGAGHVGLHVARIASSVGFRVHVVDDREKFANAERFPEAVEVIADHIPGWLAAHDLPAGAYAVIVTRGHRYDLDALQGLLGRDLRYLGMIGSRAKVARVFEALAAAGTSVGQLRRVHAPIGLDIGAVSPEEIAVSIVAELIAAKYDKLDRADRDAERASRSLAWTPAGLRG